MADISVPNTFCPVLSIPGLCLELYPGQHVKLNRFSDTLWVVCYGWYSWGGNRKVCGWYLVSCVDQTIKPVQDTDLDDIYLIKC